MPLQSGDKLGPYEIEGFVGAGGMGEVYRARDSRLNRTVAIKVLPSHLTADPELKQRLEREARAISGLQHANICVLHDVGHESQRGVDYLVFEFLEGETLLERLRKGPLALPELVKIASQIADALDRAHAAGIVHRDLKPANVMLTKSGAKLLDFGLAKPITFSGATPSASLPAFTAAATMAAASPAASPLTQKGMVVGTFNYMSPEQVQGQDADSRSDIFTFGALLYEMATGKRAFEGKSQLSVASAILDKDPEPVSAIVKTSPPVLDHVIMRALQKDPEDRWQSVRDIKTELQWMLESPSQAAAPVPVISSRRKRERLLWAGACVVLLGIAAGLWWKTVQQPKAHVVRFSIPAADKSRFGYGIAVSPDGTQLCFATVIDASSVLSLRSLDTLESRTLPNTEGADFPFWSPDGKSIGFFAQGKLKRIDIASGTTQVLAEVVEARGGSWGANGDILYTPRTLGPIMMVRATGSVPVAATKTPDPVSDRWPFFLPDGKHFLFLRRTGTGNRLDKIIVAELGGTEQHDLTEASSGAQYASGHLVYVKGSTLFAQPFDARATKSSGEPASISDGVQAEGEAGPSGFGNFSVAEGGVLVFNRAGMTRIQPVWFDLSGNRLQTATGLGDFDEPAMSPDGSRVAVDTNSGSADRNIYVLDLQRGTTTRISLNITKAASPIWSPDGKKIAFRGASAGYRGIYLMSSSAAGNEELVWKAELDAYPDSWSKDGKILLFESASNSTNSDVWALPITGDRQPKPFLNSKYNEAHSTFSPDSRWVAYSSDESGRSEIYVQDFPAQTVKLQISTEGGDQASWSPDGKGIYYIAPNGNLTLAKVNTSGGFTAETPKALFHLPVRITGITDSRSTYAISADGKRMLVMELQHPRTSEPVVVLNWDAALNQ